MKKRLFCLLGLGLFAAMPAHADIKIAVVGPLTGANAAMGAQMKSGAEMAVAAINQAGGVLGQKLALEVADDACDPKQAVAVANKLVDEGIPFVAGHYCSGSSIPASSVYDEGNVIEISPASTNPELTENGRKNVFRVCGRDDQQGKVAGDYLAERFGHQNIAVVNDKSAYGKGLADETEKTLKSHGITPAIDESITVGEKDYSALISKLKAANIAVIYFGGYHPEAGLIIRQARSQGLNAVLMGGDALVTQELWTITGPAGEGTLMTFSPDPRLNPEAADAVKAFKAQNINPEGYVLYTYAAVQAWVQAATAAGSPDAAKTGPVLHSQKLATVLGSIGFDAKGDVSAPGYVVYSWHAGTYGYVDKMAAQ